jgi:hypothetical protein
LAARDPDGIVFLPSRADSQPALSLPSSSLAYPYNNRLQLETLDLAQLHILNPKHRAFVIDRSAELTDSSHRCR